MAIIALFLKRTTPITKEDYAQIIRLQLVVADKVEEKNKAEFDEGHFLYSTYHLNNQPSVAGRILRMYYMLGNLCKDKTNFAADVQANIRDYPAAFWKNTECRLLNTWRFYYGSYNLMIPCNNRLNYFSVWRNIKAIYKAASIVICSLKHYHHCRPSQKICMNGLYIPKTKNGISRDFRERHFYSMAKETISQLAIIRCRMPFLKNCIG